MEAQLIKVDGTKKKINIKTFDEARQIVCNFNPDGLLELVTLTNGRLMLLDEEGKNKNYPLNTEATSIAHESESIFPSDYIVGDIIIVDDSDEFECLDYEDLDN